MSNLQRVLFYMDGYALPKNYTYTRSTAIAKYTDEDGLMKDAAINALRREWEWSDASLWYPDTPSFAMEGTTYTNLNTQDDLSLWSQFQSPTITSGISDPEGGTGAYIVEDANATQASQILKSVAFGSDGTKSIVFVVRENTMPASGDQQLQLYDATATTSRCQLRISSWSDGEPNTSAAVGTFSGQRYVGNGYWALYGIATGVVAANTNNLSIVPALTANQTGAIDVWRVNAYESTQLWSILDASEAKQQEQLYATFSHAPQAMCGMVDFREIEVPAFGTESGLSRRIMHIGNSSNGNPKIMVHRTSSASSYTINHTDSGGTSVTSTVAPSGLSWGDRVQLFWWLGVDGSVQIAARRQALGSSTWSSVTTASQSSANALPDAWSGQLMFLGHVSTSGRGRQLFYGVKIVSGDLLTASQLISLNPGVTIGGLAIPVQQDTIKAQRLEMGDRARAFDGTLRETISARMHIWSGKTTPLTVEDRNKVVTQLESSTQPQEVFGSLLRTSTGGLTDVKTRVTQESLIQAGTDRRYVLEFTAEQSS